MKELTIEEKAKRYDEALERYKAKQEYESKEVHKFIEYIFPELKKDEDEMARKYLISFVELNSGFNLPPEDAKKILAWLEKQGEQNTTKDYSTLEITDVVRQALQDCESFSNIRAEIYAARVGATVEKLIKKQGEQKHVVIIPKFRIGDEIKTSNEESLTITKIDEKGYWSEDLFICSFEDSAKWELVGKLVDKVEPKFKDGDWVVYNNDICQIVKREEGCNKLVTVFGIEKELVNERNLSTARLWNIKDAKDGDVLFTSSTASHETFIFKSIDERGNAECYFAYDSEDGFREGKYHFIGSAINCKPATKEQRDTLERCMTNAGYIFDFGKKELKKIEKNPVWSEEDENRINRLIAYFEDKESFTAEDDIVYANWLKSLKDRVQLKVEWNEEDEKCIRLSTDIIDSALRAGFCVQLDRDRCVDWLKSLRPRSNQEVDEQIETIAMHLDNCGNTAMAEILRSCNLRPQST